ncbi:hypothetical protein [Candidatus Nitrosocosmicus sp. SS]|jgi:hypothetical protein|uniref:hypothetical protein n=1 Tax=Candidatus Nitrosocosmicus agrestis TaxID=2563600 RepID=UPI00122E2444|nr:hypothetical protein [Candidatus Nitrosocosmicus sp. SS]KAA2281126.1 hypothetical protein F1Z66_09390 [Candidatus Nitrosocosmicus sp. SS]KAF0869426.1 hypothetical protein E5N71_05130 [Candidatus Nitrosocosmicus sp. SS]MDR4491808.1 hypothetical protein [Candidatus Nitrosocosmicus sp.]
MTNEADYKGVLKYLVIFMLCSILVIDVSIALIPDAHIQHGFAIISLNTAAAITTILAIIAVLRHGLGGKHGKSYLFLTIGIALWFVADAGILYSYFVMHIDEFKKITILDSFWLAGYVFLTLHLISIIKTIKIKKRSITASILLAVVMGFIIVNIYSMLPDSDFILDNSNLDPHSEIIELPDVVITVLYPMLDLSLIVPSIAILINIYKDYRHSVPWVLASTSLLVNAIADNGYTIQYIDGAASAMPWDLFYIADFIIMSGALFWYNKYHISEQILKRNERNYIDE